MTPELVIQLGRDALAAVLLISAPLLGASLLVGLVISVFQATTQIQEATLTFVPKIIAVLVVILLFGPWMLEAMMKYVDQMLGSLNTYTFIR
ncbi:flagellar biosynthetic protein fliq, putative [Heliomicrobium modesticaldum Ice1]|uniref:Flagellar biosynthetic protein FliQ n=1 Tax=Heliobacterium modesticaldum (strain ATCC 51547 / Ice1) TaxID=498761 RepID=B0THC1_HELMI|nr:flagellar biosynthesis protein FliQ [Heliomicrobium modesticaldum]ABZ84796.1 flagellar biosynthetic protein fliq, putative [Heliomicrobium modesticaldum Ice1]